jgi:hypothetical protein
MELIGPQVFHAKPHYAFDVASAARGGDSAAQWDVAAAAMRAEVEARHLDAARRFVRHLLWSRYPAVGRALSCALPRAGGGEGKGDATPLAAALEIRYYQAGEGGLFDIVLRRVR